jgi:hypothetical protein
VFSMYEPDQVEHDAQRRGGDCNEARMWIHRYINGSSSSIQGSQVF